VSLTFSDRGTKTGAAMYRRGLVGIVVIFALVIAVAGFTTLAQGPQLRSFALDTTSVIKTPSVALTLRSDRALAEVSRGSVVVTPEAEFELDQGALELRVVFTHPLRAGTNYTVQVRDVRPRNLGAGTSWSTTFQTPHEDLLFLRSVGNDTELVRFVPDGSEPTVVYRAPGIVGFAPVGVVYAVHRQWQEESILELVDPVSGGVDRIAIAPQTRIASLASASWGTSLLVTLDTTVDGQALRGVVALLDTVGQRTPEIVTGADGRPLRALKVQVSPVTGNVLVWLLDQSLVIYEPLTGVAIPLGVAAELWGFTSLGAGAVFVDALGTVAVDIRTREETRIPVGQLDGFPVFHELTTVSPQGLSYQRVVVPGFADGPDFVVVTVSGDDGVHRRVFGNLTTPESIGAVSLSPNGHYLALEVNAVVTPFGYAGLTEQDIRQNTRLVVINVKDQAQILDTPGFSFSW
jgi:hypothetical protein